MSLKRIILVTNFQKLPNAGAPLLSYYTTATVPVRWPHELVQEYRHGNCDMIKKRLCLNANFIMCVHISMERYYIFERRIK